MILAHVTIATLFIDVTHRKAVACNRYGPSKNKITAPGALLSCSYIVMGPEEHSYVVITCMHRSEQKQTGYIPKVKEITGPKIKESKGIMIS